MLFRSTKITPLKKDSIYNIEDKAYVDMMILDSLLILIADKDDNYFHIFNKKTMDSLISFGKKGNAEFEFNHRPLFRKNYYENFEYFEVYDPLFLKRINIKNITEGANISGEIKSERLDEELVLSREIAGIDSSRYTIAGTTLDSSNGLFYIYYKKSKSKKWASYNPKLKIDKRYYDNVYYGLIESSPDNETIVYCPRFFNRILFYNKNGEIVKELNFSKVEAPLTVKDYFGVSHDELIYTFKTYRTKNFIYVLRPLQSLNNLIENISPIKVQILRITWDGHLDATYEADLRIMPTLFCVDEQNQKILFNTPVDSYLSNDIVTEISVYNIE